MKRELMTIV